MSSLASVGMLDLQIVTPAPTGDGGLALNDNFTKIANASPLGGSAAIVALSNSASNTVVTDASLSNIFSLTLAGSGWTMSAPTNGTDGQKVLWRLVQDSTGSRTVTWSPAFNWGAGSPPTLSTTPGATDYVTGIYDAGHGRWDMIESSVGFQNFTVVTFTSAGTVNWNVPAGVTSVQVLVVAGGGGGGYSNGGAGGAGGLIYQDGYAVTGGSAVSVTVGGGGAGGTSGGVSWGSNGDNSVFGSLTAIGGGGGGCNGSYPTGFSGGSGGGGSGYGGGSGEAGGSGTTGQGNAGAASIPIYPGGGGGASAAGTAPAGGAGLQFSISGGPVTYATGGSALTNTSATANTGNGGGGAMYSHDGGAGGSGIVIIRY